ncbi:MAG: FkbM family methyltransferase, partial [Saprospiraceae bacterium]
MLKKWLKKLPIPITQNHRYDIQAKKVIKKVLTKSSNCMDVGCHEGEFLDLFLKYAPAGQHFAFEPLPDYYENLVKNYGQKCKIHPQALSDKKGESTFNYVISNPAYSGLQKRNYDKPNEKDTSITVETDLLDDLLPAKTKIDFIKIDVEG